MEFEAQRTGGGRWRRKGGGQRVCMCVGSFYFVGLVVWVMLLPVPSAFGALASCARFPARDSFGNGKR